jgi:hypothetical protein
METQILCDKDGDPLPDSNKFEKDGQVWGPIRWPYKAATEESSYSDPPMTFLIEDHMVAIGSTGWDWQSKKSRWVGYDFDSLVDHSEGVGIPEEEMEKVVARAPEWVEIVRSTRGNGRHLYIFFDDPPTTNTHTEHAALARAFLPILSASSGLDLSTSVDVCGSVLWLHHRNATQENRGYSRIRSAVGSPVVPPNWRDNIEVVNGGRSKVRVRGYFDDMETEGDELDQMTQAHTSIKLDETHHAVLDALQDTGYTCLWVGDHNLAQTHTAALKQVYLKWADSGHPMKGLFDTNTTGGDAGKPNCFMRPKLNGAWDVYRFGQNTREHELWDKQGQWTHTTYNYPLTLAQVAAVAGGFESPDQKGGYLFNDYTSILAALELLKSPVTIPAKARDRTYSLRARPDGKLIVTFAKEKKDVASDFPGWAKGTGGWGKLVSEPDKCTDQEKEEADTFVAMDEKIRMLKCISYEDLGSMGGSFDSWVLKDDTGKWVRHPKENVALHLQATGGHDSKDVNAILGGAINKSWALVNEPFQPEFPGGRVWNMGAAQFVYRPIDLAEGEIPYHPHWDKVMGHCGCDLDVYIPHLEWCKEWGIKNGGHYLTAWVACLLRYPFSKLPYLFMYGPQNSGKSIFHEAIGKLVTRGVMKADRALTSTSGYNGELLNVVLGVIDEVDISKSGSAAYNKLKEWTTGLTLSVHAKYKQVHEARSSLHFVQCANSRSSLPVAVGDTRITAMNVPSLLEEIPKDDVLIPALQREAPAFMRTIMDWHIPEAVGRLMLPVIETQSKADAMAGNRDLLEVFIDEHCFKVPGAATTLSTFHEAFLATLDDLEKSEWGLMVIRGKLIEGFPIGKLSSNTNYIGNLSMVPAEPSDWLISQEGRLVRKAS